MKARLYREMAMMNAVIMIFSAREAVRDSSWVWVLIAVGWFVVMLFNIANYRLARRRRQVTVTIHVEDRLTPALREVDEQLKRAMRKIR